MKRWILIVASTLVFALLVSSAVLTRPAFNSGLAGAPRDELSILPLEQGLTFARVVTGSSAQLVIVRSVSPEGLQVVDVGTAVSRLMDDPLVAIAGIGLQQLEHIARTGVTTLASYDELGVPLTGGSAQIAAGTTYAAHAAETGIEDGVFLFPETVRAHGMECAGNSAFRPEPSCSREHRQACCFTRQPSGTRWPIFNPAMRC